MERFRKSVNDHLYMKYAYWSQIGPAVLYGLCSRIGLDGWVKKRAATDNPVAKHFPNHDVCSTWAQQRFVDALGWDPWPQFGDNRLRPSMMPDSEALERVS